MGFTNRERKRIATRARTLRDHLRVPAEKIAEIESATPDGLMDEWKEKVAADDNAAFTKRLDILGLSKNECRRRIETSGWPEGEPLPEWIGYLDGLVEYVQRTDFDEREFDSTERNEVPFIHLLSEFVAYASEQVDWETELAELSARSRDDLERGLLNRLKNLSSHALFLEFKVFVASYDEELAFAENPAELTSSSEYYTSFIKNQLEGGLTSFFVEYAALSKALVAIVRNWIEMVHEFGSRLSTDRATLTRIFGSGNDLGTVTAVTFLGDPHLGGRQVLAVTFESGTKIAYKPRGVEPEKGFTEFVGWINDSSDLPDLRTLTVLPRDGYGWIEWVDFEECSNRDEISTYYERAGMLLCLLYVLQFTDGHLENVIAVGDQPVLVDLETLFHPIPRPKKSIIGNKITSELIFDSVLQTGLLPVHHPDSDVQNVGGFGSIEGKQVGLEIPDFENVNTDAMDLKYRDEHTMEGQNLPSLDGEPIVSGKYSEDIANGFEQLYRFLLNHREEILREGGPFEVFEDIETRLIVRSTSTYGRVLSPLTTPPFLRSGAKFGCRMETLTKPLVTEEVDPELWPVYEIERESLLRFDIPRFTVKSGGTTIYHDNWTVEGVLETCPLDQVSRRIERLDETDLREQLDYVHLAYAPESLAKPTPDGSLSKQPTEIERIDGLSEEKSREIYERIRDNEKRMLGGDITWYHREYRLDGAYVHRTLDSLYEGRVGIALFAAALTNVTGEDACRKFTHDVLSPLLNELGEEELYSDVKLGAAGIGSFVYGFTKVAELLDDDSFVIHAREAASHLLPERIAEDTKFDLVSGSAGVILGLLPLYERCSDGDVLEKAVTAGEHLLSNRVEVDGVRVWESLTGDPPQVGNLHGVAGIAHALVRLAEVSGESRFRDVALESLEYERQKFSSDRMNWPDLQSSSDDEFSIGWRAGRAGIGLSRLGMFETYPAESFRREIEHALEGFDVDTLAPRDDLVDGNLGRVEFLLRAGRTLDEPKYQVHADRLVNATVRRAEKEGGFTVPWQTTDWYNPSFFTGESGIGYVLLRLTHPRLPCVLLWE